MTEARRFGRFEVRRVLGRGGMGTVYEAVDPLIGRVVAIKEILIDHVRDPLERKELEDRFKLEFRAAGTLSHPNIVTIYDVGQEGGAHFIAMEYINGSHLAEFLRQNPRPPIERVLDLASQIAAGLDFAHEHGLVHRDVKPANVLLTRDGRPKITDFGLVKLISTELTTTGTVMGTPAFMSPEQIRSERVDGKSDQFSLAVILYLMLVGEQPFWADHPSSILYKIVHELPQPPAARNPALPQAVDAVLLRGLAKSSAQRFNSCQELVDELRKSLLGFAQTISGPMLDSSYVGMRQPSGPMLDATFNSGPRSKSVIDQTHLDSERTVITPRTHKARQGAQRNRTIALAAIVGLVAVAGFFFLQSGGSPEPKAPSVATAPPATKPPSPPVKSAPEPMLPSALEVELVSQPAGATLLVSGKDSGLKTPSRFKIEPDTKYDLAFRLEGYEPARLELALATLTPQQKLDQRLSVKLKQSIPPGTVEIVDADYPFEVEVGGKKFKGRELQLAPGSYSLVLVANEVFLRQTYPVEVKSGETLSLRAPQAFPVRIVANPANCRVSINGRFVDVTPINDRRLVAGRHELEFTWPALQRTKTMAVVISRADQQIFASLDG